MALWAPGRGAYGVHVESQQVQLDLVRRRIEVLEDSRLIRPLDEESASLYRNLLEQEKQLLSALAASA